MKRVANPLYAVNKDSDGTGIKNRLQRAANINRQQEHQVHNEQEDRQAEEAVEDHFIHRRGKAAGFGGEGITDRIANGGNALVAGIGDMQRRVIQLFAQIRQGYVQLVGGVSGEGAAINIAFKHL